MKAILFLIIIVSLLLSGFNAMFSKAITEVVGLVEPSTIKEEFKSVPTHRLKELHMYNKEETVPSEIIVIQEQTDSMTRSPGRPLFTFGDSEPRWYTVNDTVMGGISNSMVRVDPESQTLTFSGNVSLENNGGFASTRTEWTGYDLSGYDGILMRVRGDGNVYRLRTRTERTGAEVAYTSIFKTEVDTWQEVYIPFAEMIPTFRGFVVGAAGPLDPSSIRSFGLMVADKQQGQFYLEVDWINAVAVKRNAATYASIGAELDQVPSLVYADN